MTIHVGDIGTIIEVTATQAGVAVDISSANTDAKKKFYVTKPDEDATEVIWQPVFSTPPGTDGKVRYVTLAGDLNAAGLWELQLWVELTSWSGFLASLSFEVSTPTSSVDNGVISVWGGPASNSYVSLGYANGFILKSIINHTAWIDATVQQRVSALLQATKDIDNLNFWGESYYRTQFLEWPRSGNLPWPWNLTTVGSEDLSVEQTMMKDAVKKATCYQALWLLSNQTNSIHTQHIALGISKYYEKTGPLEEGYTYGSGSSFSNVPSSISPDARKLLAPWITGRRIARS